MAGELAGAVAVADILSSPNGKNPFTAQVPDVLERAIAATHQGGASHSRLSRDQKAAIIVRLLKDTPDNLSLDGLTNVHMTQLVQAMAKLNYVDEPTVLQVIKDFLDEIDSIALYFQPGLQGAIETLGDQLSDEVTTGLAYVPTPGAPPDHWATIATMEIEPLAALLAAETPQINAVVLSKLPAVKAAEVLGELDSEMAKTAIQAALQLGTISAQAIDDIGAAIVKNAETSVDKGGLPGDPVDRVGAFLNFAAANAREDLLNSLESTNRELAEKVRQVMFTFADIPDRVEVKDMSKIVRMVENDVLVVALAAGSVDNKEVVEFIFANLSKRLSEQLEEEVRDIGEVKPKDGDAAINTVIQAIRTLEERNEIVLISPDE